MATGILFSRLAGLAREGVFSHYLGTSLFASAFRSGLRLPNVLQNMLGEGTLSASFIPVYSSLLERGDRESAGRLAGAVFALLLALAGALTIAGIALAPILVRIFFPGHSGELRESTIAVVRVVFPMTGLLVLSAWALGVLNSHRRFLVPYLAPVLWNAAIIVALFIAGGGGQRHIMMAAAWGALAGGGLQFAVQLPWLLRLERSLILRWDTTGRDVRQVVRNAGPAILGRGAVQLGSWIDLALASFLPFAGTIAAMTYAQTLYILPFSLFGMAVAAAELPELSRQGAAQADALRQRVHTGLERMALLVVPSAVGYILIGDVVTAAVYQRGAFTPDDTALVAIALAAYALGLIASTASRLYASVFYALNDTRTPARIALLRVLLAGALGLGLMLVFETFSVQAEPFGITRTAVARTGARPLGIAGLALGTGIAAWLEWGMLRSAAGARIGRLPGGTRTLRLVAAATLAGLPARVLASAVDGLPPLAEALVILPFFGLAYVGFARWLGVRDVLNLIRTPMRAFRSGPRGDG
ncbi:MAG: murein biosynthesis integral membrane protein MurJ [Gemmatimonadetes bacterium]|nr:murein biosynthesis integral membrane protein MurJ [Gemmatimonadota bacterium]